MLKFLPRHKSSDSYIRGRGERREMKRSLTGEGEMMVMGGEMNARVRREGKKYRKD